MLVIMEQINNAMLANGQKTKTIENQLTRRTIGIILETKSIFFSRNYQSSTNVSRESDDRT